MAQRTWQEDPALPHDFQHRRDALNQIWPRVDCPEKPAASSVIKLLLLRMFLPEKIVAIVEETVGWPDLRMGNRDVGQVLLLSEGNYRPLRRVVQALRDIQGRTLTQDVLFFIQNLQAHKTLLGRLLVDLKLCREMRSPRNAQLPLNLPTRNPNHRREPDPNDLTDHAGTLEFLVHELDAHEQVVIQLGQLDRHILTVHQLLEFLS